MPIQIFSLFLIFLFTSCEDLEVDESNPFEADSSEQIPDVISLQETIDGSSASYTWEGNDFALEFRYKLEADSLSGLDNEGHKVSQPYFEWSNWITETNIEFSDLDEGKYTFYVISRFDQTEEDEPESSSFEINTFSGPALRIYPLHQTKQPGDEFDVYLYFEDVYIDHVNPINLLQVVVTFSGGDGSNLPVEINGEVEDLSSALHCSSSNNNENPFAFSTSSVGAGGLDITITHVYLDDNGDGLCGTGPLVRIPLKVLATDGNININIEDGGNFQYYNFENDQFENYGFSSHNGYVTVEEAVQ